LSLQRTFQLRETGGFFLPGLQKCYVFTIRVIRIRSSEFRRNRGGDRQKKERRNIMAETKIPYKIYLEESEMPREWYNVRADMKNKPAPLLNPETLKPMTAKELDAVFCDELVKQELDNDTAYIEIPEEIRNFYKMYRPSPLVRAYCLEEKLQTPAKIYYKFEGNNTSGSHKLNSAIAQAYYAKKQGLKGVTTETGAGQWGTALSMACAYLELDCQVYMVKCSYEQKPFRREVMRTYGAQVTPSPSETTEIGRKILAAHPGTSGSLGCAISEAVETAGKKDGYRYVLGSVLNQVLLHQTVIGLETKTALDKYDIVPDIIIGCAGGGSNLGGLISPFMGEKLRGERDYHFIAVEPASCPSLTRGKYVYDFCDTGMVTPLAKMYTLGSNFIPSASHAGGLRYHGMSSILSQLYDDGLMEARSVEQTSVFEAAQMFAKVEGILPAPESAHAIRVALDEAMKCKETGEEKTIVFGLTGTGYFDMVAYGRYNDGQMSDYIPTDKELQVGFDGIPKFPGNEI
jgi:tryptophan synthase beta chain